MKHFYYKNSLLWEIFYQSLLFIKCRWFKYFFLLFIGVIFYINFFVDVFIIIFLLVIINTVIKTKKFPRYLLKFFVSSMLYAYDMLIKDFIKREVINCPSIHRIFCAIHEQKFLIKWIFISNKIILQLCFMLL